MALMAMLLAAAIWGCTFPLTKQAFVEISPLNFTFLRFFISSIVVAPFLGLSQNWRLKINKKSVFYSTAIGGLTLLSILLQGIGLNYTSASLTSFISGCPVIFIFFIKAIVQRETPSFKEILCAIICILGLSLITLDSSAANASFYGVSLIAIGTLAFAVSVILCERASRESMGAIIVLLQNIVCCLLVVGSGYESLSLIKTFSSETWLAIVYCSIISSLGAYGLQAYAQKRLNAKTTSMILMLEPIFGSILAFFYLGEDVFNLKFILGSILILLSVGYLSYIQEE